MKEKYITLECLLLVSAGRRVQAAELWLLCDCCVPLFQVKAQAHWGAAFVLAPPAGAGLDLLLIPLLVSSLVCCDSCLSLWGFPFVL